MTKSAAQPTILAVDDETSILEILHEFLSRKGYRVLTTQDGPTALEIIRRENVDLVLTDFLMKPMDGMELLGRIRLERPDLGVILFTAISSEDIIVRAMKAGAVNFVKKPFILTHLEDVVQNALAPDSVVPIGPIDVQSLIYEEKHMEMASDPAKINGVVNQLTMNATKFLNPTRARELAVALHEVIINAIEHGNLEITYEEKSRSLGHGKYKKLLADRCANSERQNRRVFIEYRLDPNGLYYSIRDQGPGFDWRKMLNQESDQDKAHGRGLILAAHYVDKMEFNEQGNTVSLSLFFNGKGAS